MPTYPFVQVDAFTTQRLAGNPCAVVFDADELSTENMQAIAREMNLSETVFVLRPERGDARARYFTPGEEIPFAGHPTVATAFALAEAGQLALQGAQTTISLELPVGLVPVTLAAADGRPTSVSMDQPKPSFLQKLERAEVAAALSLAPEQLRDDMPVQVVSTGVPQLMVPVRDHEALRAAALDLAAYRALRARSGFFSTHIFCLRGFTDEGHTSARHLGFAPDTLEDPFTGSATGAMGAYLWHHGLIDSPRLVAEQGHWMERPGRAEVEVIGQPDDIETVRVAGPAVTVMRGEILL